MSFEPQPVNPFGWIILLGAAVFFFYVAGYMQSSPMSVDPSSPPTGRPSVTRPIPSTERGRLLPAGAELLMVDSFDLIVRESFPPQIVVAVSGYWPNGCSFPSQTNILREGNTVFVHIFRIAPPDVMCTQVLQAHAEDIPITEAFMDGDAFRSGTYEIDVNGVVRTATF